MPLRIFELLSERRRNASLSGVVDVFKYDELPKALCNQISLILEDVIGNYYDSRTRRGASFPPPSNNEIWEFLIDTIVRETGDFSLDRCDTAKNSVLAILTVGNDVNLKLDLIDMAFRVVKQRISDRSHSQMRENGATISADEAIAELNHRFRQSGIGYRFESEELIRIDSEFIHSEVVLPALALLRERGFEGPDAEYRKAHKLYREGLHSEAIVQAANAFESTMKVICTRQGWSFDRGARSSDLVKVLRSNRLFPEYLSKSFDQLLATLNSGLPEVRNNSGGHGGGEAVREVPAYVAAFALHLAASKILFLLGCMNGHR